MTNTTEQDSAEQTAAEQTAAPVATAPRKSDTVKKLLRRAKGASVVEMQEATHWQPHSVRAFLSGLRKKGSAVTKEQRKSGETAYRLASKVAAAVSADA